MPNKNATDEGPIWPADSCGAGISDGHEPTRYEPEEGARVGSAHGRQGSADRW